MGDHVVGVEIEKKNVFIINKVVVLLEHVNIHDSLRFTSY